MNNIVKACKHDHGPSFLQALDWLLVQVKINYNLSTICHNFSSDSFPAYLSDLLIVCTPSTQLCSSADTWILRNPQDKTKIFDQCSFSYCTPKQWNPLPSDICHIQSSQAFKTMLKTRLHKQYHNRQFQNSVFLLFPSDICPKIISLFSLAMFSKYQSTKCGIFYHQHMCFFLLLLKKNEQITVKINLLQAFCV